MAAQEEDHYMAGKLLLAMPGIGDPRFHRAVIFVCTHDENGAMGLVINNVMADVTFADLVQQLKFESDIKIDSKALDLQIMRGGPVETARGFLLHSNDFSHDDTMSVDGGYSITGTIEALKDIARGEGPGDLLFILGYAGWDAGQLDIEIQKNAWLVVEPDPALVFDGAPEEKWTRAVDKLGFDPAMLSHVSGQA